MFVISADFVRFPQCNAGSKLARGKFITRGAPILPRELWIRER